MRRGQAHSSETRERMREAMADPERRAAVGAATKSAMADPAVRQRIRDGMLAAPAYAALAELRELRVLREKWKRSRPAVRARFINEIFEAACFVSARDVPETADLLSGSERDNRR